MITTKEHATSFQTSQSLLSKIKQKKDSFIYVSNICLLLCTRHYGAGMVAHTYNPSYLGSKGRRPGPR
jgi:hypothetical protein